MTERDPLMGICGLDPVDTLDVWGNKIAYIVLNSEDDTYALCSFGPNGIDDGGEKDDIFIKGGETHLPDVNLQGVLLGCLAGFGSGILGTAFVLIFFAARSAQKEATRQAESEATS